MFLSFKPLVEPLSLDGAFLDVRGCAHGELLPLRLLGVGATRLTREAAVQGDLFDDGQGERRQALDGAVDAIRDQFGSAAIRRGSSLGRRDDGQG